MDRGPPPDHHLQKPATGLAGHHLGRGKKGLTMTTAGCMTIADRAVLVTGANRGIGQALVTEALSRGAKRVYAGTRQPLAHPDGRVTPLILDVTSAAQILQAVENVESLDVLIKASPESVARAIFDGVENGDEDIFPDPMSASVAESWRSGAAKALERQNAALLAAASVNA
jgi:NAD(P)-dependent dehydrogenase (short-subunit alcohol dehydrogenase family)